MKTPENRMKQALPSRAVAAPPERKPEPAAEEPAVAAPAVKLVAKPAGRHYKPATWDTQYAANKARGVVCTNRACRSILSDVTRTVREDNAVVRYRKCTRCGQTWKTVEA